MVHSVLTQCSTLYIISLCPHVTIQTSHVRCRQFISYCQ